MEDRHKAIVLGVLWFLLGGIGYVIVAVLATLMGMGLDPGSNRALYTTTYAFIVFGLPLPMVFGWAPPVYRLVRGKPRPWTSAIVMGVLAVLLPIGALVTLSIVGAPR